jgi:microcompartment protein CcmK/EutM
MLLRSLTKHVKDQNWFAVALDFFIVVAGILIAFQITNWSEARQEAKKRDLIIDALITNLTDSIDVQKDFTTEINTGFSNWEAAYAKGEQPAPYYFLVSGSDTAPDTWSVFEQMSLTELFDPVTLFDLTFFYSELDGVGRKYTRYATFVENRVLPGVMDSEDVFYSSNGQLKPEYAANMDRLRTFQQETDLLTGWGECLVYRLEANRTFEQSCRRVDNFLEGMQDKP